MIDIHAITGDDVIHVLTMDRDLSDNGPVQLISEQRLALLLRIEANYLEVLELFAKHEAAA
jgi:hypothetical protein